MTTADQRRSFVIVSRYLVSGEGWKRDEQKLASGTPYETAGREASRVARQLDERFGDSHFWTVDLVDSNGVDGSGSYFQLFHGRLS